MSSQRTISVRIDEQIVWSAMVGPSGETAGSLPDVEDSGGGSTDAEHRTLPEILAQIGSLLGLPTQGWVSEAETKTVSVNDLRSQGWSLRTLGVHTTPGPVTSSSRPDDAMSLALQNNGVWRVAKLEQGLLTLAPVLPREVWARILGLTTT
jgi:hypothetical protein